MISPVEKMLDLLNENSGVFVDFIVEVQEVWQLKDRKPKWQGDLKIS